MSECIAVIQYDIKTDSFVLYANGERVMVPFTQELNDFIQNAPSVDINDIAEVKRIWSK